MGALVLRRRMSRFTRSVFSRMNWVLSNGYSSAAAAAMARMAEQPDVLRDRHERTIGRGQGEGAGQSPRASPSDGRRAGMGASKSTSAVDGAGEVDVVDVLVERLVRRDDVLDEDDRGRRQDERPPGPRVAAGPAVGSPRRRARILPRASRQAAWTGSSFGSQWPPGGSHMPSLRCQSSSVRSRATT